MTITPEEVGIGVFGGACYRRACRKSPATWFNKSTEKYYCHECAMILNDVNDTTDARRLNMVPLCVEGKATYDNG